MKSLNLKKQLRSLHSIFYDFKHHYEDTWKLISKVEKVDVYKKSSGETTQILARGEICHPADKIREFILNSAHVQNYDRTMINMDTLDTVKDSKVHA